MIVFASDLDNTLIYSHKHDIRGKKRNVEIYQNREISYISERTYELLTIVNEKTLFVPVTTRSIEQYKRIDLGLGRIKYALVCNGGILLVDGKVDESWREETFRLIEASGKELEKGMSLLARNHLRKFEVRLVDGLFVFTKCDDSEEVVSNLKTELNSAFVDVFKNGEKIYIIPKNMGKGIAVKRFRERFAADYVIAAGDSDIDLSMADFADEMITPDNATGDCDCVMDNAGNADKAANGKDCTIDNVSNVVCGRGFYADNPGIAADEKSLFMKSKDAAPKRLFSELALEKCISLLSRLAVLNC